MKTICLLVMAVLFGTILTGCNKAKTTNGPTGNTNAPAATPTPDKRQQAKGMYIVVAGIDRSDEIKNELDPTTTENTKPSKASNDFAQVVLKLLPVKDPDIIFEPTNDDSVTVLSTTDGKLTLKSPYRAIDSLGNQLTSIQSTWVRPSGGSKEVTLIYVYELARAATVAKIQLGDFTLNVEAPVK